ncbi:uncharacterized protein BDR25DRAFT_386095 [Lindgomyces ingoldianus]|uniref:Uncharacterized protein n=1 Tax=Lindgomyces ingoldianus TaxID=673940 RepID=A0ACB6Q7A9_9PLEO|nr:uncharacterized protein BDR25DRAFT_386095 [Lindgomyces ingoldianus]KAF2462854.1 hypothetical protein BDR25DRAFT_386095 [Lindgomyces ingoldianus]
MGRQTIRSSHANDPRRQPTIKTLIPYAELIRLHRLGGNLNIFFPCFYGYIITVLTTHPLPSPPKVFGFRLPLMVASAFLLRSMGCAWNDIMDASADRQVERTRSRPMARRAISVPMACFFTAGLFVLWISTLIPLIPDHGHLVVYTLPQILMVLIYPLGKRVSYYAQFWLGITLGWGVFLGAEMAGFDVVTHITKAFGALLEGKYVPIRRLSPLNEPRVHSLGACYAGYVVWSVIYDTIYAFQDVRDDRKAGLKSMAVLLGAKAKPLLAVLSAFQVLIFAYVAVLIRAEQLPDAFHNVLEPRDILKNMWSYFLYAVLGNFVALASIIAKVDLEDPKSCNWWFQHANIWVGVSIGAGLVAQYIFMAL